MKFKIIILLSIFYFFTISCKNKKAITETINSTIPIYDSIPNYKKMAIEKLGREVDFIKSPKESYVLCKNKLKDEHINPNQTQHFFVYDLKTNKIVYQDKEPNINLSWKSDTELKIIKQLGIIKNATDTGQIIYIYNLITKEKGEVNSKSEKKEQY